MRPITGSADKVNCLRIFIIDRIICMLNICTLKIRVLPIIAKEVFLKVSYKNSSPAHLIRVVGGSVLIFLVAFTSLSYAAPGRIVSLAPSMTEILYALGLQERIVGVTAFCDYPPEAREKPKIGGMSNPSLEAVVSSRPDIVVMTTDGNPKEFELRLKSMNIRTYVFRAKRIHELPDALRDMGRVLGVKEKADELAKKMEQTVEEFSKRNRSSTKKIIFIIWPEPLIVAGSGTAIDDTITLLGHKNIGVVRPFFSPKLRPPYKSNNKKGSVTPPYPKYSIEELIRRRPDFILIGRGHENMRKLSEKLLSKLKSTPAVRNKKVFYVSDSLYRLGPRVVDGIEEIAKILEGGTTPLLLRK